MSIYFSLLFTMVILYFYAKKIIVRMHLHKRTITYLSVCHMFYVYKSKLFILLKKYNNKLAVHQTVVQYLYLDIVPLLRLLELLHPLL